MSKLEEAREAIARTSAEATAFTECLLDEVDEAELELVLGNLEVTELRRSFGAPLVVTGNLKCHGVLTVDERSHLIVLGDLTVRDAAIWMAGLYVGGRLSAAGLVYLNSGNDYSCAVEGGAEVRVLHEAGMHTFVGGATTGKVLSTMNQVQVNGALVPHATVEALCEAFVADLVRDGALDEDALMEAIEAGRPVCR